MGCSPSRSRVQQRPQPIVMASPVYHNPLFVNEQIKKLKRINSRSVDNDDLPETLPMDSFN